jgi:magnesium transporter
MSSKSRKRSRKFSFKRRTQPGATPGQVCVDPAAPRSVVSVIAYGPTELVEKQQFNDLANLKQHCEQLPVTWINVDGLGDATVISQIGKLFGLHPLALEDVVNVHQRAKVEEYDGHTFIVARMVELREHLETEQVSLFLGPNFVITFQERPGEDSIEPVRERLRKSRGRIRALGADYLAYAILDAVIDGYFPVLEQYGERLESLELEVTTSADRSLIGKIHDIKSDLLMIRRSIWPHREAFNGLVRDSSPLVKAETRVYLRDCYDHTVQLIDLVETYRELGADLRDVYLSSVSNRMNEIMKVLTIISTIFMPLSFIASVYGMNFNTEISPWNMPELNWYYGYPFVLGVMATMTTGMLIFFRRKGWLGGHAQPGIQARQIPIVDGPDDCNV